MINRIFQKIKILNNKTIAIVVFVVAFILRFSYSIYAYINNVMAGFKDDLYYHQFATEIVNKGRVFYETNQANYDMIGPGLPWINSLSILVFGESWLGIFFVTSVVSALITLFTYKVALLIVDRKSALLAAFWSCFYLYYIMFSPTAGKDIWMAFFLILLIYMMIKLFHIKVFNYMLLVLFTFIYVFSVHLDERFFMFTPFILIYIIISETKGFTVFHISKSFIFMFLFALFIMPWGIRNFMKYKKIVLISTRTEQLTDKLFGYPSRDLPFDHINDLYGPYYIHDYQIDSVIAQEKTITDGGYKISAAQRQAMMNGKLPKPFSFTKAFWIRTKDMLRPFQIGGEYQKTGYYYYKKSLRHNLTSFLFYGFMFIFSIPGFFYLYKRNINIFFLLLSTIVIYTFLHGLFVPWTTWRYRLPLDALFIIMGSYGLNILWNQIFKKVN